MTEDKNNKDDRETLSNSISGDIAERVNKTAPRLFWWSFLTWVYIRSGIEFVFPEQKIELGDFEISGVSEELILQGLFFVICFYFWRYIYFSIVAIFQSSSQTSSVEVYIERYDIYVTITESIGGKHLFNADETGKYMGTPSGLVAAFLFVLYILVSQFILYFLLPISTLYELFFLVPIF